MVNRPPVRTLPLHLALVAIVVFGVATACSGGESEESTAPDFSPSDPIIANVLSRLADLSSYHVTITASAPPQDPLRTGRTELDSVAPDSYRVSASQAVGETKEVCTTETSDGSSSRNCLFVLTAVTGREIGEGAWNGETMFYRECGGAIEACTGAWYELPPTALRLGPASPPLEGADIPNWHLEALRAARDLVLVEGEGTTGQLLHYRGGFNPVRATNRAAKNFLGEEVYGYADFPEDQDCSIIDPVGPSPRCRYRGGYVEKEQIEAYETSAAPIDIWVSSTDSKVQRISAVVPGPPPGFPEITVELVFSQFNGVEIEFPPEE